MVQVSQLRAAHAKGDTDMGVDVELGKAGSMQQLGIFEAFRVKQQVLRHAPPPPLPARLNLHSTLSYLLPLVRLTLFQRACHVVGMYKHCLHISCLAAPACPVM